MSNSTSVKNSTVETKITAGCGWNNLSYVEADDGNYATAVQPTGNTGNGSYPSTGAAQLTGFGFTIPSSAVIKGVLVTIKMYCSHDASGTYATHSVRSTIKSGAGDNKVNTNHLPTSPGTFTYGGATDLWNETLTPAIINDPTFAYTMNFAVYNTSGGSVTLYIGYVEMTVYYAQSQLIGTVSVTGTANIIF